MSQANIETSRLVIRTFNMDDLAVIHRILDQAFGDGSKADDRAALLKRQSWLQWSILNQEWLPKLHQPGYGERAITLKAGGALIGAIGYVPLLDVYEQIPALNTSATPGPYNIVCHGHSVPAGYFTTPLIDSLHAYPHLLFVGLKERFAHAALNVIVTAIGGENAESGAARFAADVLCHKPDVVTIDYALNDRQLGLARAEQAWRSMIEAAVAKDIKVILLTPTHDIMSRRWGDPMWATELPKHTDQVARLAAEYGVALADSYGAFQKYIDQGGEVTDLLSHINHPNRQGHQLVVRELLRWFPAQ